MEEEHEPQRSTSWESVDAGDPERSSADVDLMDHAPSELPESGALKIVALEQRIQRLEDAVARMQDTKPIEERVAERITAQINQARGSSIRETTGFIVDAGRRLLPAAINVMNQQGADGNPATTPAKQSFWRAWFLLDLLVELRAIFWMFVDPRYRLGWPTRIVAVILLALIGTSTLWPPASLLMGIPVLGLLVDKLVDLILAYLLWKILSHEARRYRQIAPDLPTTMRL
jgi:hypothetical protein